MRGERKFGKLYEDDVQRFKVLYGVWLELSNKLYFTNSRDETGM